MERDALRRPESAELIERSSDRRVRRHYVFRDRRTGFDRRAQPSGSWWDALLLRMHHSPRLVEIILVLLVALNLADLVFTQVALGAGAVEANPIMAVLFDSSFASAAALKILVSMFIVFVVLAFRDYRKMMALTVFATALYSGVFTYHLATTPLF
jgi:hypothetical protein